MKAIPDSADLDWFGTKPAREAFPPPKGKRPPQGRSASGDDDEESDDEEDDKDEEYDDEEPDPDDEDEDEEDEDSEGDLEAVRQFLQARKEKRRGTREGKGHIHTDKWHRCVEHVKKRGGGYEPHAVCTSSIGYKGSVNPEHRRRGKARESASLDLEMQQIFRESERGLDPGTTLFESNDCHNPAGSPNGGQFCSNDATTFKGQTLDIPISQEWRNIISAAAAENLAARKATGARARVSADWRNAMTAAGARTDRPGRVRSPHKVQFHKSGEGSSPQHVASYRGMEIHTLPSYTTPYYFVNAPGFGSMEHSPSLTRIRRQIDTFKDTGMTARAAGRAKASARYQKRKARYGR